VTYAEDDPPSEPRYRHLALFLAEEWRTCARRRSGADAAQRPQAVHLARRREEVIVEEVMVVKAASQFVCHVFHERNLLDGHMILIQLIN